MTDVPELIWADQDNLTWVEANPNEAMKDCEAVYVRSDLCASGQQVRALEWEQVDPTAVLGHGIEPCQYYIRYEVGSWWMHGDAEVEDAQEFDDLEAAKAAAQVDYERRILAALTPAPQPEGQDALKISPEYQALFDEVKQRAQPEGCDNPSGMVCAACRSVGMWHCSDPENCGGMKPMRSACTCNEPWCKACASAPTPATPTAQEAVPVAWMKNIDGAKGLSFQSYDEWTPLYAHPYHPSVTVSGADREAIAFALWQEEAGNTTLRHHRTLAGWADQSEDTRARFLRFADAALRALKGDA